MNKAISSGIVAKNKTIVPVIKCEVKVNSNYVYLINNIEN